MNYGRYSYIDMWVWDSAERSAESVITNRECEALTKILQGDKSPRTKCKFLRKLTHTVKVFRDIPEGCREIELRGRDRNDLGGGCDLIAVLEL